LNPAQKSIALCRLVLLKNAARNEGDNCQRHQQ
jgi:hypothetical protein